MQQTRLHFNVSKDEADRVFPELEAEFEDEGFPLAVVEMDEARDIHEVSVYAMDDVDQAENRNRDILARLSLSRAVGRRGLPGSAWCSKPLDGRYPCGAG